MVGEWRLEVTTCGVPGCHGRPPAVTEGEVVVVHDRVTVVGDALGLVERVPLEIKKAGKIHVVPFPPCTTAPE